MKLATSLNLGFNLSMHLKVSNLKAVNYTRTSHLEVCCEYDAERGAGSAEQHPNSGPNKARYGCSERRIRDRNTTSSKRARENAAH